MILDKFGCVQFNNPNAQKMLDITDDVLGKNYSL